MDKDTKCIPQGEYCYTPVFFCYETGIYEITPCLYYERVEDNAGICKYYEEDNSVDDQCKICSFNIGE